MVAGALASQEALKALGDSGLPLSLQFLYLCFAECMPRPSAAASAAPLSTATATAMPQPASLPVGRRAFSGGSSGHQRARSGSDGVVASVAADARARAAAAEKVEGRFEAQVEVIGAAAQKRLACTRAVIVGSWNAPATPLAALAECWATMGLGSAPTPALTSTCSASVERASTGNGSSAGNTGDSRETPGMPCSGFGGSSSGGSGDGASTAGVGGCSGGGCGGIIFALSAAEEACIGSIAAAAHAPNSSAATAASADGDWLHALRPSLRAQLPIHALPRVPPPRSRAFALTPPPTVDTVAAMGLATRGIAPFETVVVRASPVAASVAATTAPAAAGSSPRPAAQTPPRAAPPPAATPRSAPPPSHLTSPPTSPPTRRSSGGRPPLPTLRASPHAASIARLPDDTAAGNGAGSDGGWWEAPLPWRSPAVSLVGLPSLQGLARLAPRSDDDSSSYSAHSVPKTPTATLTPQGRTRSLSLRRLVPLFQTVPARPATPATPPPTPPTPQSPPPPRLEHAAASTNADAGPVELPTIALATALARSRLTQPPPQQPPPPPSWRPPLQQQVSPGHAHASEPPDATRPPVVTLYAPGALDAVLRRARAAASCGDGCGTLLVCCGDADAVPLAVHAALAHGLPALICCTSGAALWWRAYPGVSALAGGRVCLLAPPHNAAAAYAEVATVATERKCAHEDLWSTAIVRAIPRRGSGGSGSADPWDVASDNDEGEDGEATDGEESTIAENNDGASSRGGGGGGRCHGSETASLGGSVRSSGGGSTWLPRLRGELYSSSPGGGGSGDTLRSASIASLPVCVQPSSLAGAVTTSPPHPVTSRRLTDRGMPGTPSTSPDAPPPGIASSETLLLGPGAGGAGAPEPPESAGALPVALRCPLAGGRAGEAPTSPLLPQDCLAWARALFGRLFYAAPCDAYNALHNPALFRERWLIGEGSPVPHAVLAGVLEDCLYAVPRTFEDCLAWARRLYERCFEGEDAVSPPPQSSDSAAALGPSSSTPVPSFAALRRSAHAVPFDPTRPLHRRMLVATARLRAQMYGLPVARAEWSDEAVCRWVSAYAATAHAAASSPPSPSTPVSPGSAGSSTAIPPPRIASPRLWTPPVTTSIGSGGGTGLAVWAAGGAGGAATAATILGAAVASAQRLSTSSISSGRRSAPTLGVYGGTGASGGSRGSEAREAATVRHEQLLAQLNNLPLMLRAFLAPSGDEADGRRRARDPYARAMAAATGGSGSDGSGGTIGTWPRLAPILLDADSELHLDFLGTAAALCADRFGIPRRRTDADDPDDRTGSTGGIGGRQSGDDSNVGGGTAQQAINSDSTRTNNVGTADAGGSDDGDVALTDPIAIRQVPRPPPTTTAPPSPHLPHQGRGNNNGVASGRWMRGEEGEGSAGVWERGGVGRFEEGE